jgi:hypothetical protein
LIGLKPLETALPHDNIARARWSSFVNMHETSDLAHLHDDKIKILKKIKKKKKKKKKKKGE